MRRRHEDAVENDESLTTDSSQKPEAGVDSNG